LITGEINRILRELNKPPGDEKNKEENRQFYSLSRLESGATRDSLSVSEGHISLSRKGSMQDMGSWQPEPEEFPTHGTLFLNLID
jgi:hypothetical protein